MSSTAEEVSLYDQVLYPAGVFPQTHPIRLATIAFLRGMEPAPIQHCRVLELGCGVGGNIIPMAFHLPESEFVGLDLARQPITSGQAFATGLGLRNISLSRDSAASITLSLTVYTPGFRSLSGSAS
jgi:tRNA G46 methylase TrmB